MARTINNLSDLVEALDEYLGKEHGSARIYGGYLQGIKSKERTTLGELGSDYPPAEAIEDIKQYFDF